MAESRLAKLAAHLTGRGSKAGFRVAVLGASGGIGQPLSLLLKKTSLVRELHLYDVKGTKGVMADLSHINTLTTVRSFEGNAELGACLKVRENPPYGAAPPALFFFPGRPLTPPFSLLTSISPSVAVAGL